jgi:hypothetical protein
VVCRYLKETLFSLNVWGKSCPPEIAPLYISLPNGIRERTPATEHKAVKSPSKQSRGGQRGGRRDELQLEEHPDEKIIFSANRREETFK